ncbi:MAG: trigger factor [Candidatus Sericytochromatia bacterium]
MKVTLEKKEKNKLFLEIEVEAKTVAETYERKFRETARNVTIPGFRKGKAPKEMVKKYIYEDMLQRDVVEELISTSFPEALTKLEDAVEPIESPQVEINKFAPTSELVYKATIEVRPDIALGQYKDLAIEVDPVAAVDDEAIEKEILELRKSQAQVVNVERPVQQNDIVLVDIYGEVEGEQIPDGTTDNLQMEIKPGNFVEGFTEQLVGANVNEKKVVEITFPDNYPVTDLRQKQGKFDVLIKEIQELQLPELNEEFVQKVSAQFKEAPQNVDDLKAKLKDVLVARNENLQKSKNQEALVDSIVNSSTLDVPESMEKKEMYSLWQMREGQLLASRDVSKEVLEASWENWQSREDVLSEARKRIKTTLIFSEISKKENITLTREEIDNHLGIYARVYGVSVDKIKEMLDDNGRLLPIIDELLSMKVLKWLEENSKVTVKS